MGFHSFISSHLRFKSAASTVSTAVSFLLIIISVAVASGFRHELGKAVCDMSGDFRVIPISGMKEDGSDPVDCSDAVFDSIRQLKGVVKCRPVIYQGGIMRSGQDMHGVIFRGTDDRMEADSLVRIPARLAKLLQLKVGDRVPAYFVKEDLKVRPVVVNEIYDGLVTADDRLVVECNASVLRKVNGWNDNQASAEEIVLQEGFDSPMLRDMVEYELSGILYDGADHGKTMVYENIRHTYHQLFEWLNLIDSNVTLILVLMIIVAGFNMVTGLLIFIFNNIHTIAVLKSLGMKTSDISKSFMLSAGRSVAIGMLAGNILAVAFCLIQSHFGVLTLNPDNYFIDFVPIRLNLAALLFCDILTFAAIMLILIIPCLCISRIEPAESLKSE